MAIKVILELELFGASPDIVDAFNQNLADSDWFNMDILKLTWEKTFDFPKGFEEAAITNVHLDLETASMYTASSLGQREVRYTGYLRLPFGSDEPIFLSNIQS